MKLRRPVILAALAALIVVPGAQASITASIDFGTVTAPVTQTVTFTNPSVNTVTITGAGVNGSRQSGPFTLTGSNGCLGAQLAPGGSCQQDITFDPTVVPPGEFDATFTLTYDDAGTPTTASTDLTGIADGSPQIEVTSRSTTDSRGAGANGYQFTSASGRFVAFASDGDNVVNGFGPAPQAGTFDRNETYLRDRTSGTTVAISVNMTAGPADRGAVPMAVTPDGRFVLFASNSPDLVPESFPNGATELFLRDTVANTTQLVSTNADGQPANASGSQDGVMSHDATIVCFDAQSTNMVPHESANANEVLCKNLTTGAVHRADAGVGGARPNLGIDVASTTISGDGRYVLFSSRSKNIVRHDINNATDVFLHDRATGRTRRVNTTASGSVLDGSAVPALSSNGARVSFWHGWSWWVKNLNSGRLVKIATDRQGGPSFPATFSPNGRLYAFVKTRAGHLQVYLERLRTGQRTLISQANGSAGNDFSDIPQVGSDGSVTFTSSASNLKVVPDTSSSEVMTWTP